MKLNLGCGFDIREGYINLDNFNKCNPDILHDLEVFPYPFATSSFDEILIKHVLEHVGEKFTDFKRVMQEIYRISMPNARIEIHVPNYKHLTYWSDPTHVRAFDELTFKMMSRKQNDKWIADKKNYTMLSYLLEVDFELINTKYVPCNKAVNEAKEKGIKDLNKYVLEANHKQWNVIRELWFELKVIKN